MAVDNVITSSSTGVDGNSFTSSVSNDKLTNEDFLTLMLEEMKMQDPTKPMDSAALMDSQLKMSTIESNQDMSAAMLKLQASYSNSALSTAANMIGRSIQNGEVDDTGEAKIYKVASVDNKDGVLSVQAKQFVGVADGLKDTSTDGIVQYDENGVIYDSNNPTDYRVSLNTEGRFNYNEDGSVMLLDTDSNVVTDTAITSKYSYGGYSLLYTDDTVEIPLSSVTAVS
jgi:flagellar basal-body rod modification protein FlgD